LTTFRVARTPSPIGTLLVAVTEKGVARIAFPEELGAIDELADEGEVVEQATAADPAIRQLDGYFSGRLRRFTVATDLSGIGGFARRALEATALIPYGSVATYGQVAAGAGSPRGARAAGNALAGNPVPIIVPCHRVVPAAGGIGGYGGHEERKEFLLRLEGSL
jgi:methylated-DNA-[protein]-cysteine S-methyltransferase